MREYEFPIDFIWGVATGSYQIEGAWDEAGKGESIWDRFVHTPGNIKDGTSGDVTCDFYHHYMEDIDRMKSLGYPNFLLTISWPRVMPEGTGAVNPEGIQFYRNVLGYLRENGIKSYVVLYHWDLPQKLQDRGGWANREIVGWFENYARLMYQELGDLADHWITILEPHVISILGHWQRIHAPGHHDYSETLRVAHHLNLSHGTAVRAYRESGLPGKIGIKISNQMVYPADPSNPEDIAAAKLMNYEFNDLFGDPIMLGEYPQEFLSYLRTKGIVLPTIQEGDMELIHQEIDFYGLNSYTTYFIKAKDHWPIPAEMVKTGRPTTQSDWEYDPEGFYEIIKYINNRYHPKEIIITENGCASNDWVTEEGRCEDPIRCHYIKNYLRMVHRVIEEGIPLKGYFVWSLMDNFEWAEGLAVRFGLIHIDFKTLKRTPKTSAYFYSDIIKNNSFHG